MGLTYPEIGATATDLPDGYRHVRRTTSLASGDLDRAGDLLLGWEMHRRAGLKVPDLAPATTGDRVTLRLGLGPLGVDVPCEIVYVVDEPDARGFAYGTLEGHPESGEELFVVRRGPAGLIFEVTAFSRPATRLARAMGPFGHVAQDVMTARYLRAMRKLCS